MKISALSSSLRDGSRSGITSINAALPISIFVAAKSAFNRYELKIGKKSLRTKSMRPLSLGSSYWGELSGAGGNIIIHKIIPQPFFGTIVPNYSELLNLLLNARDKEFVSAILSGLESESLENFKQLSQMLMALAKGVFSLSFIYENEPALLQIKPEKEGSQIYLALSPFGPLSLFLKDDKLSGFAEFASSAAALGLSQKDNISPLFKTQDIGTNLLDIKQ